MQSAAFNRTCPLQKERVFVLVSYPPKQSLKRNVELKGLPKKRKSPATSVTNTRPSK